MSLLTDAEIIARPSMIAPFEPAQVRAGISYGLSSMGYDIRLADEFRVFSNVFGQVVDPKAMPQESLVAFHAQTCLIPPNSFALARSVEHFVIPDDIIGLCVGKSTYARCGIIVNITPLEPGWEGILTLEISNTTPLPARIYANEGIAQVLFFRGTQRPLVTYRDRQGKYQAQDGVTLPRI